MLLPAAAKFLWEEKPILGMTNPSGQVDPLSPDVYRTDRKRASEGVYQARAEPNQAAVSQI